MNLDPSNESLRAGQPGWLQRSKPWAQLLIAFLLAFAGPARAQALLFDQPAFRHCEAEAFLALVVARNAMHLDNSKATQLAVKSNGAFTIAAIEEVYADIARSGTRDHGGFAARKFYECVKREGLPLDEKPSAAAVCLARQDIVFFLNVDRQRGRTQADAGVRIKGLLSKSSKTVYPEALIDQLLPMVYRISSDDDEYDLRQFVFETCLMPEDWTAWFKASQEPRK